MVSCTIFLKLFQIAFVKTIISILLLSFLLLLPLCRSANADVDCCRELNRTIAEVQAKEEMLNRKEVIITNYINELNLSRERETSLGMHFIDIKNENVYLSDKLNKTLLDSERWQNLYNTTQRNYDVCKMDLQLEKTRTDELSTGIIEKSNEMYVIVAILLSALFVLLLFYVRELKENQILRKRITDNSERRE